MQRSMTPTFGQSARTSSVEPCCDVETWGWRQSQRSRETSVTRGARAATSLTSPSSARTTTRSTGRMSVRSCVARFVSASVAATATPENAVSASATRTKTLPVDIWRAR